MKKKVKLFRICWDLGSVPAERAGQGRWVGAPKGCKNMAASGLWCREALFDPKTPFM